MKERVGKEAEVVRSTAGFMTRKSLRHLASLARDTRPSSKSLFGYLMHLCIMLTH